MAEKIRGFTKTHHFSERQTLRLIKDEEIFNVLDNGTLEAHSEGMAFVHEGYKIGVCMEEKKLITVHAPDRTVVANKIFSLEDYRAIKAKTTEVKPSAPCEEEDHDIGEIIDLDDYLSGRYFKKSA